MTSAAAKQGAPTKLCLALFESPSPPASHHQQNIYDFPVHFSCLKYTDDFLQIHERRILKCYELNNTFNY